MDDELHPALLPAGLRDILPPDAEFEAEIEARLMATLAAHGYERVKPPLVEFESNLLSGPGAAMARETFRMMDPASHRMIGVRADMTPQIARIATARLSHAPRPLRLSYAGQVLRVSGSQLQPERQFGQVGVELIGSDRSAADAETIALAVEALLALGVPDLSVDLTLPPLVPAVLKALGTGEAESAKLRSALDHKDAAAVAGVGGRAASILGALMAAAAPASQALERMGAIDLPAEANVELVPLREIVTLLLADLPDLALTVDPVENRGFEYQTGVSFTLFGRHVRGELGRGGRYRAGLPPSDEPSTGFTLYTDTIRHAIEPSEPRRRILLPAGTKRADGAALRAEGWVTVLALEAADAVSEAKRLGCFYVLGANGPAPV